MNDYKGVKKTDIPSGAGYYVDQNRDGGEVYNFFPIGKKYFGFARVQSEKNISLTRLGANKNDEFIDNITIVFFAKNKSLGGQYIVGWYKEARLYKSVQLLSKASRSAHPWYNCEAEISKSFLIPELERTVFEIPADGPGQSNVWHVMEYHNKQFIIELEKYISNPKTYIHTNLKRKKSGTPWQKNIEIKKKVELAAMKAVQKFFENLGFTIEYKHKENLGWDLEAKLKKTILLLEVKGLSGELNSIELTRNEFTMLNKFKNRYRLCIVTKTLTKEKIVHVFYHENNKWISNTNLTLNPKKLISARFEIEL